MDESTARSGRALLLSVAFTLLSSPALPATAAADLRFSILYHESVELYEPTSAGGEPTPPGEFGGLRFDAFGRRFDVRLNLPARLNGGQISGDFELFEGRLAGMPDSWVRLMRRGDSLSGVINDGEETYFIEPRSTVSEALAATGSQNKSTNVIYRLADTLIAPGMISCETRQHDEPVDGQTAFAKLTAELSAIKPETAAAELPTANIGVITDLPFFDRFEAESKSEIESLFNMVDGFYRDQVGVGISIAELFIIESQAEDPFSTTGVGGELLDELGDWRRVNQAHLDLTHLVTDRRLISSDPFQFISGLSFVGVPGLGGVCFPQSGAGISAWSGNLTALIITHEIAHNFGAPHDGEPSDSPARPNPCESTPSRRFIMGASLNSTNTDEFSACSIQQMQKVIDAATCLHTTTSAAQSMPEPSGGGSAIGWPALASLWIVLIAWRKRRRLPDIRRITV